MQNCRALLNDCRSSCRLFVRFVLPKVRRHSTMTDYNSSALLRQQRNKRMHPPLCCSFDISRRPPMLRRWELMVRRRGHHHSLRTMSRCAAAYFALRRRAQFISTRCLPRPPANSAVCRQMLLAGRRRQQVREVGVFGVWVPMRCCARELTVQDPHA